MNSSRPSLDTKTCKAVGNSLWKTKPGYFQITATSSPVLCTAGFYCPNNTIQPYYCCPGFYCSTPDTIQRCPLGYYCPTGSQMPLSCFGLAVCPPGTVKPVRIGMLAVIFFGLLAIVAIFKIKSSLNIRQSIRNKIYIEILKQNETNELAVTPLISNSHSIDIEFHNLEYKLPDGSTVMSNVSGLFRSGKMCAIMGPSGAGKTTLFCLLTGKIKKNGGTIFLNGKKEDLLKYHKLIGFCPQEDIMLRELTVSNILMHSANMRLSTFISNAEKRKKVLKIIDFLGLGNVINSVIGDVENRGISGGQRKRVNIGMEVVTDPSILFLDEPSSGLDSSTALELFQILNNLARNNNITIASIVHSPSIRVFYEFQDVLFLGKGGRVVYFGATEHVLPYFNELGFNCGDEKLNPADFAMDVISGKIECPWDPDFRPEDLFDYWECYMDGTPIQRVRFDEYTMKKRSLRRMGTKSNFMSLKKLKSIYSFALHLIESGVDVLTELLYSIVTFVRFITFTADPIRQTPNVFIVYWLLLRRASQQQFRNRLKFLFDDINHFIAGVVVSIAIQQFQYLGTQPSQVCDVAPAVLQSTCRAPVDYINYAGMLICVGVLFSGQTSALVTFGNEMPVYWRDTSSGMPTIPYILAKFTVDLSKIVIASLFYTLGLIMFVDYRSDFLSLALIMLSLYFVAFNFGYLFSVLFDKNSIGLVIVCNALLWSFLFGGVSPDLNEIYNPEKGYGLFRLLWDYSAPRWAIEAYYIKEVTSRQWVENSLDELAHTYNRNNYTKSIKMMFLIGISLSILLFLAMKLKNRRNQH
eukprot:NODE_239_length_13273_cov_0.404964.p2 type:complete len:808 gc:universal NODE_239_length_13273_cov_0.404964:12719-10296(-)